jgi:sulfide:quinone oxidoreductase
VATHQARRAAAAIARLAGAEDAPDPGEPVIHGRLLVGRRTRRLTGRGDGEAAPLWWPQGKIAGQYLPRWLTEHGVTPPAVEPPPGEGVTVEQPLSRVSSAEQKYLFELAREFRSGDPAIAALGRRMQEARKR